MILTIKEAGLQVLYACLTLNPPHTPKHTLLKWTTSHPVPLVAASKALSELNQIQKKKEIWFCRAYQGAIAAQGLLKRTYSVLNNPKLMAETQGDLVLVDAFIHGNFSSVDKNNGLLNLFMPSDEASRPISPMDAKRSRDDNNLNDIL
ncbi:hypothetical protein FXO37_33010 [Capsicum annuum]|nr:hypothetical protein FXO37_33010 [Capsicum annuum]